MAEAARKLQLVPKDGVDFNDNLFVGLAGFWRFEFSAEGWVKIKHHDGAELLCMRKERPFRKAELTFQLEGAEEREWSIHIDWTGMRNTSLPKPRMIVEIGGGTREYVKMEGDGVLTYHPHDEDLKKSILTRSTFS